MYLWDSQKKNTTCVTFLQLHHADRFLSFSARYPCQHKWPYIHEKQSLRLSSHRVTWLWSGAIGRVLPARAGFLRARARARVSISRSLNQRIRSKSSEPERARCILTYSCCSLRCCSFEQYELFLLYSLLYNLFNLSDTLQSLREMIISWISLVKCIAIPDMHFYATCDIYY